MAKDIDVNYNRRKHHCLIAGHKNSIFRPSNLSKYNQNVPGIPGHISSKTGFVNTSRGKGCLRFACLSTVKSEYICKGVRDDLHGACLAELARFNDV